MNRQPTLKWILALLFSISNVMASDHDAFKVFLRSIKEVTLYYRSTSGKNQKVIANNWYVRYEKNTNSKGKGFETFKSQYQPILSVVSTTKEGIYLRTFKQHWLDINANSEENTSIEPIFEVGTGNEILCSIMNDNETLLTVALKNDTLMTIDLRKSLPKRSFVVNIYSIEVQLGGEDSKTTAIGLIPYTNYLVFSPNRFQFYKMDRLTGEVKYSNRSYLDSLGHIVHPTPTHHPKIDPHNPNKFKDPKVNQRIVKLTELTYFVGTATKNGVNVLVDWVTMKVIKYWSLKDINPVIEGDQSSYIVRSICYFGGTPQTHIYPLLASRVIDKLYLFHGIHRNIVDGLDLPKKSLSGSVRWINGTSYVYILQTDVVGDNKNRFGSYFLNLGQFTQKKPIFMKQKHLNLELRFQKSNLISFDNKIEESITFFEIYNQTNFLFLFMYSDTRSLHIRPPPFNWDLCKDTYTNYDAQLDFLMLYGSYMSCESDCQGGFSVVLHKEHQNRSLLIECRRYSCEKDKVPHMTYYYDEATNDYTYEGYCEKYQLKEAEKDLAHENGCDPGYNLDNYGICRECDSHIFAKKENEEGEQVTDYSLSAPKNFAVSDCLFFNEFNQKFDSLGESVFHYQRGMTELFFGLKGYDKKKKLLQIFIYRLHYVERN